MQSYSVSRFSRQHEHVFFFFLFSSSSFFFGGGGGGGLRERQSAPNVQSSQMILLKTTGAGILREI